MELSWPKGQFKFQHSITHHNKGKGNLFSYRSNIKNSIEYEQYASCCRFLINGMNRTILNHKMWTDNFTEHLINLLDATSKIWRKLLRPTQNQILRLPWLSFTFIAFIFWAAPTWIFSIAITIRYPYIRETISVNAESFK